MEKIIVFDFDKTLTDYDTTLPFFLFCCKRNPIKYIYIPLFIFIKLLSKCRLISVRKEKGVGLRLFCPSNFNKFKSYCVLFSQRIVLNDLYFNVFKRVNLNEGDKIIIASASFQYYLEELFPNVFIIGTSVEINKKGKITGIIQHPFVEEKAAALKSAGFNQINIFYTDSKNDIPTSKLSDKTVWVRKGKIIY